MNVFYTFFLFLTTMFAGFKVINRQKIAKQASGNRSKKYQNPIVSQYNRNRYFLHGFSFHMIFCGAKNTQRQKCYFTIENSLISELRSALPTM